MHQARYGAPITPMWRYVREAFFVRVPVPSLGDLPVNVMAVAGFGILGLANPGFWLLGVACEAAVLSGLAFNRRFQRLVDGRALLAPDRDVSHARQSLIDALPAASKQRLDALSTKCTKVLTLYQAARADSVVLEGNREALRNLEWVYLKLLVAESHLRSHVGEDEQRLRQRIGQLEADLQKEPESQSLRESKSSTLEILKKRLALWRRREQSVDEISSDLVRIEAQVDLLVENATLEGRPQATDVEIELATELAGGTLFGDAEAAVKDVDDAYARRAGGAAAPQAEANTQR
jgi:hypothetical protein